MRMRGHNELIPPAILVQDEQVDSSPDIKLKPGSVEFICIRFESLPNCVKRQSSMSSDHSPKTIENSAVLLVDESSQKGREVALGIIDVAEASRRRLARYFVICRDQGSRKDADLLAFRLGVVADRKEVPPIQE